MTTETDKSLQLGEQLVKFLETSGVSNLRLEEDGSISGDIGSKHFAKLTFKAEGNFIKIEGKS